MTFSIFISGQEVDLVAPDLNEDLVTSWYQWFNDPNTTKYMQKHYYPNTQFEQKEYIKKEVLNNPARLQLGIVQRRKNTLVGMISLSNIDYQNQQAEIGGLIGDPSARNLRIWLEANQLLIRHAHQELNLTRLYGGSLSEEVALFYERLLEFRREGVLQGAIYKSGKFHNVYLFARVHSSARIN